VHKVNAPGSKEQPENVADPPVAVSRALVSQKPSRAADRQVLELPPDAGHIGLLSRLERCS